MFWRAPRMRQARCSRLTPTPTARRSSSRRATESSRRGAVGSKPARLSTPGPGRSSTDGCVIAAKRYKSGRRRDPRPGSSVVHARPGGALVAGRNLNALWPLERVLKRTDTEEQDVVVMTVLSSAGPHSGERDLYRYFI